MKTRNLLLPLFACIFSSIVFRPPAASAGPHALDGEVEMEETTKETLGYREIQDKTIETFTALESQAKTGNMSTITPLMPQSIDYLAAAYLHCSLLNGTCPIVLEGLLEVDVVNAKLAGNNSCPNMTNFWRSWVKADMERRMEYNLKVGFIPKANEFKKMIRPRFIKCQDTITTILAGSGTPSEFFAKRYGASSEHTKAISDMATFLGNVKQKIGNVFSVTGTR